MSNEEKILQILTAMQEDIAGLKTDVAHLQAQMDQMAEDIAELKGSRRQFTEASAHFWSKHRKSPIPAM